MSVQIRAIGFLAGLAGDLVISTPAIREFKRIYPEAHLTIATGPQCKHMRALLAGMPEINEFHAWKTYKDWPAKADKNFLNKQKFDMVFNPFPQHTRPDWYNAWHYTHETALMLGLPAPTDCQCKLGYQPKPAVGNEKLVTLSMFSSGTQFSKTLRLEQLAELAVKIREKGFIPVQIGSNDLKIAGYEWRGDLTMPQAVDLMASSHRHITVDTSFSWIASAYQLPVIGLYGRNYSNMLPHRIVSHNPINPRAIYLNREKVQDIGVNEIVSHL
jgi:ADP-heptose:LPS heptosyltransferase